MAKKQFQYLNQHSEQTLLEGLKEYTNGYAHLNKNNGDDEASSWFRKHDFTHVLFGTIPFEIRGETVNDLWTLFGSDVTLKGYLKFFNFVDYDVVLKSYLKKYKYKWRVYLQFTKYIPVSLFVIFRALRMKKKWPWHQPEPFCNMKLCDLRKEFGIKVIKP